MKKSLYIFSILSIFIFFISCQNDLPVMDLTGTEVMVSASYNITGAVPAELITTQNNDNYCFRSAVPGLPVSGATDYFYQFTVENITKNTSSTYKATDSVVTFDTINNQISFPMIIGDKYNLTLEYRKKNGESDSVVLLSSKHSSVSISNTNPVYTKAFSLKPFSNGEGKVALALSTDLTGIENSNLYKTKIAAINVTTGKSATFTLSNWSSASCTLYSGSSTTSASDIKSGFYEVEIVVEKNLAEDPATQNEFLKIYSVTQIINVFDNMITDLWISNDGSESINNNKLNITQDLVKDFSMNHIYVDPAKQNTDSTKPDYTLRTGTVYNPYTTLQQAVDYIKEISVENGNYVIYLLNDITAQSSAEFRNYTSGSYNYGDSLCKINIDKKISLTIQGENSKKTIDADQLGRAFFIKSNKKEQLITLKNLKITKGKLSQENCTNPLGAGIYANDVSLVLNDVDVINNIATGSNSMGGGLSCYYVDLKITKGIISGNECSSAGGGIYFTSNNNYGSFELGDSLGSNDVIIGTNSDYTTPNSANRGGGISISNSGGAAPSVIINSDCIIGTPGQFTNTVTEGACGNKASDSGGGIHTSIPFTLNGGIICNNYVAPVSSVYKGDGVFNSSSTITIKGSSFVAGNNSIFFNSIGSGTQIKTDEILTPPAAANGVTATISLSTTAQQGGKKIISGNKAVDNINKFRVKPSNIELRVNDDYVETTLTAYVVKGSAVKSDGNDTTGNGSESAPYKTISKALSSGANVIMLYGNFPITTKITIDSNTAATQFIGDGNTRIYKNGAMSTCMIDVTKGVSFQGIIFDGGSYDVNSTVNAAGINVNQKTTFTSCKFISMKNTYGPGAVQCNAATDFVSCTFGEGNGKELYGKNGVAINVASGKDVSIKSTTISNCSYNNSSYGVIENSGNLILDNVTMDIIGLGAVMNAGSIKITGNTNAKVSLKNDIKLSADNTFAGHIDVEVDSFPSSTAFKYITNEDSRSYFAGKLTVKKGCFDFSYNDAGYIICTGITAGSKSYLISIGIYGRPDKVLVRVTDNNATVVSSIAKSKVNNFNLENIVWNIPTSSQFTELRTLIPELTTLSGNMWLEDDASKKGDFSSGNINAAESGTYSQAWLYGTMPN